MKTSTPHDFTKAHTVYRNQAGVRVPSVTTILGVIAKPELYNWYNQQGLMGIDATKVKDRAGDIGTIAHKRVEFTLQRQVFDESNLDPELQKKSRHAAQLFFKWWEREDLVLVASEHKLVSEKHQYGGTLDILAKKRVTGRLVLVDLKTSNRLRREHRVQVAGGYAPLWYEVYGERIEECWLVRLPKADEDEVETRQIHDCRLCEDAFLAAHELYNLWERVHP